MSAAKGFWSAVKDRTRYIRTRRIQQQQWRDADSTELRKLASPTSAYEQDTSYRPHSVHSDDGPEDDGKKAWKRYPFATGRYASGWRFGAINCAMSASVVFLINLIVTIWGSVHSRQKGNVLYDGDCERVRQLNTGIHFLINTLSTILLSSSNYSMQCLSAPTRKEIDEAHAKRIWLDIGVPSIHNLSKISPQRVLVWAFLGLSSLPLHLFYNSAVFSSISTNSYNVVGVSQSFVDSPTCYNCTVSGYSDYYKYRYWPGKEIGMLYEKARKGELERLSPSDCINAYSQMIQSNRRNLLLVSADDTFPKNSFNNSHVFSFNTFSSTDASTPASAGDAYSWICSNITSNQNYTNHKPCINLIDDIKKSVDTWKVTVGQMGYFYFPNVTYPIYNAAYPVDYCLSERAEPHCKLQFTLPIAILVTLLNLFKAILIFYTAFGVKEEPLMTMGDAVASFLAEEDPTTKDMCLLTIHAAKKHKHYFPTGQRQYEDKKYRWKDVTSRTRRTVTIAMFCVTIIVVGSLYGYGVNQLPDGMSHSLAALGKLGYGAIDARTIISFPNQLGLIQNVLIANIAQPILSFLYFSYNGLFTCMLLGFEWATYGREKKGLRVSHTPLGAQRSTYFLQLPYRFALPLMGLSGLLHWLVSQSIFLVAVDVYDWDGTRPSETDSVYPSQGDWKSCGYSPVAIFTVLMLAISMVIGIIAAGYVPFKQGITLAGSCSAAISAACHIGEGDGEDGYKAAMSKLQWGVTSVNADGVGHCTFSTKEVEMPKAGEWYAGKGVAASEVRKRI